eukprot:GEMP01036477.1.p1 GENE.GEMP01036477.1~~GEMP01036477.1.p1  ORF type:complete len:397 (+),score=85.05 GEMP01036477.1:316-1506(+)
MKFLRYHKIYDRATPANLAAAKQNTTDEWIVQEKIHGSNFSVHVGEGAEGGDDIEIRYGKRNGFLDFENDSFYDFQRLDDVLRRCTKQLWSIAVGGDDWKNNRQVAIYGELFGGWMPSAEEAQCGWDALFKRRTSPSTNQQRETETSIFSRPVQEGVYYSSQMKFVVFDIVEFWENEDGAFVLRFWPYNRVKQVAENSGFLVSDALLRTKCYAEAANFDVCQLRSQLAVKLNPHCEVLRLFDNLAEGVVIRPASVHEIVVTVDGNPRDEDIAMPQRFILKKKNARFAEEIENCDNGSTHTHESRFRTRIARLTNFNRLAAVLSKELGNPPSQDDAGQYEAWRAEAVSQMAADVWESFWEKRWDLGALDYDMADEYVEQESARVVEERFGAGGKRVS